MASPSPGYAIPVRVDTRAISSVTGVLAFPGLFRGMLDAQAREITQQVKLAGAVGHAASGVTEERR
ncbi:hypothetical protein DDE18_02545 [Nocardioides gansuensis]|uniref:Uncharacterized protein n=1 Tax=Nocardioides gansuensis TaxID=2138300 RepID=A0A2T8FFL1_9ACTN|nr:hypothetical protein [Nocardioides gansuensis]PVG84503.1 hypothetical protein DDE18_02545 [Nocardioides gansuensis]